MALMVAMPMEHLTGYYAGYSVPYGAYYGDAPYAGYPTGVYTGRSVGYRGWHGGTYYNGRFYR